MIAFRCVVSYCLVTEPNIDMLRAALDNGYVEGICILELLRCDCVLMWCILLVCYRTKHWYHTISCPFGDCIIRSASDWSFWYALLPDIIVRSRRVGSVTSRLRIGALWSHLWCSSVDSPKIISCHIWHADCVLFCSPMTPECRQCLGWNFHPMIVPHVEGYWSRENQQARD